MNTMKIEVSGFSEHLTMNREDYLHPHELAEFTVAPGVCTSNGHGTSTSTICCCSAAPALLTTAESAS